MNQILDYDTNSKNPRNGGGSDKIIRFFAIILIVFAIILISVVIYSRVSNKSSVENAQGQVKNAEISVETNGNKAKIIVMHTKKIAKLIYSWNASTEKTIKGSETYMEEDIDIPAGKNTLHIKVIDEDENSTVYEEEISAEEGVDIINPIIELSALEGNEWTIKATDETALDFLTYRWNEEEEQIVYAEEGSKEISVNVEIMKGTNDLTVVAVDANNNTTTETKSFKGLTKPEITVTLSEDGTSFDIAAVHEAGIEKVEFNFNDVDYNVDIGQETPTSIQFQQKLEVGYNRIIVTIKGVDGVESTFDGQYTYGDVNTSTNSNARNNNTENANNTENTNNAENTETQE